MADKRQFHVVLPWGNPGLASSNGTFLMEIPATEPYAYGLSHISRSAVVVAIHSGKSSESAEKWCKTTIFTCTDDGNIDRAVYEGNSDIDIDPRETADWQEWNYSRDVHPAPAYDTYARAYQTQFLGENPINQPDIDPTSEVYLDYAASTVSVKQTVDDQGSISVKAFDLDDTALEVAETGVKGPGDFKVRVTSKTPVNPANKTAGARVEVQAKPIGWSATRIEGSKSRVLAYSAFVEDV